MKNIVRKPNAGLTKLIKKRTGGQRVFRKGKKMTNVPNSKEGSKTNIPTKEYPIK